LSLCGGIFGLFGGETSVVDLIFIMKTFIIFIFFAILACTSFAQTHQEIILKHRQTYKDDFLKNPNSPLKQADLAYLDFYAADSAFMVKSIFTKTSDKETFKMPTSDGKEKEYFKYGTLTFTLKGQTQQLNIYRSLALMRMPQYKNYLFVPFKDLSNGKDTYGGGRYLDLQTTDIQVDTLILDFNKAYNPYCAFSNGYSCPIPPKENHLNISIEAGEKNFKKEH
jgi:uncharacterized protein